MFSFCSISELRRAFADDAREPRFIETIPKRGYRLAASVQPANRVGIVSQPDLAEPARPSMASHRSIRIGMVLGLTAAVLFKWIGGVECVSD